MTSKFVYRENITHRANLSQQYMRVIIAIIFYPRDFSPFLATPDAHGAADLPYMPLISLVLSAKAVKIHEKQLEYGGQSLLFPNFEV